MMIETDITAAFCFSAAATSAFLLPENGASLGSRLALQRPPDERLGVVQPVEGEKGAEAGALLLAEENFVAGLEPVAQVGEGVTLADLVDLVLDAFAFAVGGQLLQFLQQLLQGPALHLVRRAVTLGRLHEIPVVGDGV